MNLQEFFTRHPRVALAFSGGADSSYLLWAGLQWAEKLGVYYVKSPFQPAFEYRDALRLAKELGAEVTVIPADPLCDPKVAANPADRCYYCKKVIMAGVKEAAKRDGFDLIIDGTNASDDISDRPGFKALGEEGVLSPLRMCGITKARLRELSREAGLFTWNKPAYACLATRVPTGETITAAERGCALSTGLYGFSCPHKRRGGKAPVHRRAARRGGAAPGRDQSPAVALLYRGQS